jgi:hypothetical protein
LRNNVRMLALGTAAYMTAVITCSSSYLWHLPPPQLQLHNTLLDWQTLQQAVAASNLRPGQVWLQQHPSNTPANLASLQQSLASYAALIEAAQRGLADPQCILQQLPPFEDATECWLLHGQSAAAAAAAQRMCIHTLRRRISEASLSPFQLMRHADEPHQLVWVMDLVLLRLVDAAYGEMQEQEQEQAAAADAYQQQWQQQQQQAGVMQRQHSRPQQQQQQLQLSRSSSHPPGLQQRVQHQPLQSPRVLSPGKALQQQQQQQQFGKRGEAIPAEAPLTPSPVGEPASSTPADAAAAAAAAGPSTNHVPRSIVASAFPAQVAAPFVWPGVRVRSRIVLRRSFVGCEDALYMTDEEDSELLSESEEEGWDTAAAEAEQQQQGEEAAAGKQLQPAAEQALQQDQQQNAAVSPTVEAQEQQAPQQQQQKAKGGRPRKRKGESAAVLESCLAELDPATAAAAKEAMYGIRRSTRGDAAAAAPPAGEGSADVDTSAAAAAAAAEVQLKPRKRRASQRSTPDSAAEVAAAAAAASGRPQRSRSATPAVESSPAAAAADDAMQEQLQALAADEDIDDDTRAAIQAAMFGLRGSKHHKEQQQQQQTTAVGSSQRAGSAKRAGAAAAAGAASNSSSKAAGAAAASRPAKRSRKAAAAAASGPGCGRAMDLPQMRQAAAVTKLPGFCKSLTQALQARRRRSNAAEASAGLLQDNGYLMAVPYALPACLLTLDGAPGASGRTSQSGGQSAAGGLTGHQAGSGSSSSAAGSSRGQRSQLRAMVKGEAGSNLSEAAKWKNLVARSKKVVFERSGVHGWGLFAGEEIGADEFIIQYVGELIRPALSDTRERMYEAAGQDSSYLFR